MQKNYSGLGGVAGQSTQSTNFTPDGNNSANSKSFIFVKILYRKLIKEG
jgi:hypothetical protein